MPERTHEPERAPTGRLDAIDVASNRLTVQTEFFHRPSWRLEVKVYLGGELKKVWVEENLPDDESQLQAFLDQTHREKMKQIVEGLQKKAGQ